jgi:hypothetical protein
MTEIQKTIQILKTKKHICRIYITVDSVEKYVDGFILDSSKEFVLIRECVDFDIKGLVVIPFNKINKLRKGKAENSFTRIFKLEKLIDKVLNYDKISLENNLEIFKAIKKKYKYAIVESVYKGISDFCIGEITKVNKSSVSILYFDITGKVEKIATKIQYDEIANIEFDSNYLNTFIKYLK